LPWWPFIAPETRSCEARRRARLETDVTYDAERAAQTIATPESVLPVVRTMARRVFRKSGYRFCDQNTRQIFSDAFSNGEPASTSPENATDPLSFD
jgi:hypothetical protein